MNDANDSYVNEQFRFFATLKIDETSFVEQVECEITLPLLRSGKINLRFFYTKDQAESMRYVPSCSLYSEIRNHTGYLHTIIESSEIWLRGVNRIRYSEDMGSEYIGIVTDLKIKRIAHHQQPNNGASFLTFWITNNPLLSDGRIIHSSQDGIKIKRAGRRIRFKLADQLTLSFKNVFRYGHDSSKRTLISEEIEATGKSTLTEINEATLEIVDDFLTLISFATRRRCQCVGWQFANDNYYVSFYRRNISIQDSGS